MSASVTLGVAQLPNVGMGQTIALLVVPWLERYRMRVAMGVAHGWNLTASG
jgi:hypothetical protein